MQITGMEYSKLPVDIIIDIFIKFKFICLLPHNFIVHKQFNIIKDYYEKLDIFKHDLKNHLNYIRTCAVNNNLNEIIKYIDNITKNTNKDIHIVNSGNMLIDSILNFK